MSLLLQALQKASRNRGEGEEVQGPDPLDAEELTLEPIGRPESSPAEREPVGGDFAASPGPAQAAAIIQARRAPAFDPLDYAREHYMIVFVSLAFLVAIAYGAYVYVQVANPAWLRPKPRPATSPVAAAVPPAAPSATAPSPATSAAPAGASAAAPVADASAKIEGLPATSAPVPVPVADPPSTSAAATPAAAPQSPAAAPATPAAGVPLEEVAAAATRARAARPQAPAQAQVQAPRPRRERPVETVSADIDEDGVETVMLRPARQAAEAPSSPSPVPAVPAAAPDITQAYEALQAGDYPRAKALYADILRADAKNIDALLGSGAIAWKEGRTEEAASYYQRVLELEPRNAYAQAGLIAMMGSADPAASETRLRQLIAREPSAFLYFTLGNLYAEQGQWPGAQQAYFQAYQSQPDNPDYAFNLAVGLEHLGQPRQALEYYRKALDLSFRKGRANFDQSLVIQRVGQLSSRVEQ